MHGNAVAEMTARTWARISRQSVEYAYGGRTISPVAPASATRCASETASAVESEAMPGTTAPRPPIDSAHVRTSSTFSSAESVAPSPSDPAGITPRQPAASIRSQCSATSASSTASRSSNGVVIAGSTPCQNELISLLRSVWW